MEQPGIYGTTDPMEPNARLTNLLRDRAVVAIEEAQTVVTITFQDGLVMRINAEAKMGAEVTKLAKISQVFEEVTRMEIWFDGGEKLALRVVNPGNAVSVRDGANRVLYLG